MPRVYGISNLVVNLSSRLNCNVIGRATEGLTTARLAQWDKCRSAEREGKGSNPGSNTQGL